MSFITYDILFLILFILITAMFLYVRRKNLKREGLLYLYRTKIGLAIINNTSKKYKKILEPLQYVIIATGYILMAFILWIFIRFSYSYLVSPTLAASLKVPVLLPLIPYLPALFKIDFLPPFYFTYWILIIAIIAIPHEFAHGIFAKLNKIRVHSTGFGFLGPFLAAFVEPDEKQVQKSSKFAQLSIMAAGTFANVLATILFGLVMWAFFVSAFSPAGVYFNTYQFSTINISDIQSVSNVNIDNTTFVKITSDNKSYFTDFATFNLSKQGNLSYILAYDDTPAFENGLAGAIMEIDGKKITSIQDLNITLNSYKPNDTINIKSLVTASNGTETKDYNITLGGTGGEPNLGIGILTLKNSGFLSWVYSLIAKVKDPMIYYSSSLGDFGIFIYNLLWWIVLINLSVALTNMLPVGIFDGGRFFYVTLLGLTGSKKFAERAFKFSTLALLIIVALLMVKWVFAVF